MWKKSKKIMIDYFKLINIKDKNLIKFVVCNIFVNAMELLLPFLAAKIIESITLQIYQETFCYIVMLGFTYLLRNIFLYGNYASYACFFKSCYVSLHQRIMNSIYHFDEEYSLKLSSGKVVNTCNLDLVNIAEMPSFIFTMGIEFLKLMIMMIIFLKQNILVGIYVIIVYIIYCYFAILYDNKGAIWFQKQRKYADKLTGLLAQVLSGLKDIKTFNAANKLNHKFDINRKKWAQNYYEKRKCFFIKQTCIVGIIQFGKILLYVFFLLLIINNQITLAILLMLISYYDKSWDTITSIMNSNMNILEESVSMYRIYDILKYDNMLPEIYGKDKNDNLNGMVEFRNVSFQYQHYPTLHHISFTIKPNSLTCIIGPTGSGKTTIFNLLLRLYKINHGQILIDKINIYDYDKDVHASNITVVNQKTFIFNMSIRDNLALIDSNKTHQINVCKRVGIHDFIMSLPKGYGTILKEDATNISGGQKQLISLARALLTTSEILLLDEVTSSLDVQTTNQIMQLLEDLKTDHTIVLITHKREEMKLADQIIMLEKGKVVGIGKHTTLIKENQYYHSLFYKKK